MRISRREFLQYCTVCAAALGLNESTLKELKAALESDGAPTVLWLHGSGCQGDSVSFLNLFLDAPAVDHVDTKDVLLNNINLAYHTVVMASAGETAVTMAEQAKRKGGYVLVCEGGVPTAFGGRACNVMTVNGVEKTYQEMVLELGANAIAVLSVGTCASFGGIPAAPPNPTDVVSVESALATGGVTGPAIINIPGCPAHPDWAAWVVVQLILETIPDLDEYKRPTALYVSDVHENCPRNPNFHDTVKATTFGEDHKCLEDLGCRGPGTNADCPLRGWNKGPIPVWSSDQYMRANWCVDSNGMCFGCVEPDFPGGDFYPDPPV
jgi:hydrogenase small subunit